VVDSVTRNPDAMQLVSKIKDFDKNSYQHALDVALMMIAFGRELCLPKEDLVEAGLGGLLHDIGEVKPPDETAVARIKNIMKYKIYKEHIEAGAKIISMDQHSDIVKQIVANHHERYDGSGYPKGLKTNEPGFYGHMIAIVDTYVCLVTGRSCDKPMMPSMALGYLVSQQGKKLHPALVNQFVQLIGVYPVGSLVRLSNGEVGIVIKQNKLRRLKPVVMIVMNKDKELLTSTQSVDLLTYSEPIPLSIVSELPHGYHGIKVEDYLM
jgi:putative nucleotidyltransferase with HDIG domain